MATRIKKPIQSPLEFFASETGSQGLFICDNSHPFNAKTVGHKGFVFVCYNPSGGVTISNIKANGIYGGSLEAYYGHGTSLAIEIEEMSVTEGKVYIYLKPA